MVLQRFAKPPEHESVLQVRLLLSPLWKVGRMAIAPVLKTGLG